MSEAILKGDLLTWPRACRPLALVAALGVAISCLLLSGCALFGIPEEGGHEPELFRNAAFSGPEPLGWSLSQAACYRLWMAAQVGTTSGQNWSGASNESASSRTAMAGRLAGTAKYGEPRTVGLRGQ